MAEHYELMCVISSALDEHGHEAVTKKIGDLIGKQGGRITAAEHWGKRKLAYDIRHEKYASYELFEFDADEPAIKQLDAALRLTPEVLRHLVVIKRIKSVTEVAREKRIQEKVEAKRVAEERAAQERERAAAPAPQPEKAEKKADRGAPKISLEDLDKKLDDILKEEI